MPPPWKFQWHSMGWVLMFSGTAPSAFRCCMGMDNSAYWGYAKPSYYFCHNFVKYIKLINISRCWYLCSELCSPAPLLQKNKNMSKLNLGLRMFLSFLYCHSDSRPFQATPWWPIRVQQRDCTSCLLTGLFLLCDVVSWFDVSESVLVMLPGFRILSTSDSFAGDCKLPERGELVVMNVNIQWFCYVLTNSEHKLYVSWITKHLSLATPLPPPPHHIQGRPGVLASWRKFKEAICGQM